MGCRPEPTFFVPLSEAKGSLGAYALREDITMRRPERSEGGRRPERSEGCLANARQDRWGVARQDKKGRSAGQSRRTFLNSPLPLLTKLKFLLCNIT